MRSCTFERSANQLVAILEMELSMFRCAIILGCPPVLNLMGPCIQNGSLKVRVSWTPKASGAPFGRENSNLWLHFCQRLSLRSSQTNDAPCIGESNAGSDPVDNADNYALFILSSYVQRKKDFYPDKFQVWLDPLTPPAIQSTQDPITINSVSFIFPSPFGK